MLIQKSLSLAFQLYFFLFLSKKYNQYLLKVIIYSFAMTDKVKRPNLDQPSSSLAEKNISKKNYRKRQDKSVSEKIYTCLYNDNCLKKYFQLETFFRHFKSHNRHANQQEAKMHLKEWSQIKNDHLKQSKSISQKLEKRPNFRLSQIQISPSFQFGLLISEAKLKIAIELQKNQNLNHSKNPNSQIFQKIEINKINQRQLANFQSCIKELQQAQKSQNLRQKLVSEKTISDQKTFEDYLKKFSKQLKDIQMNELLSDKQLEAIKIQQKSYDIVDNIATLFSQELSIKIRLSLYLFSYLNKRDNKLVKQTIDDIWQGRENVSSILQKYFSKWLQLKKKYF